MKHLTLSVLVICLLLTSCAKGRTKTPEKNSAPSIYINAEIDKPIVDNNKQSETAQNYIGNKNSKVFHYPTCKYLPGEKNRVYFETRQKASGWNFRPCQKCNP